MSQVPLPVLRDSAERRTRSWGFTLNNYTQGEHDAIWARRIEHGIQYLCMGYEVGQSGTPHLQAFTYFAQAIGLSKLKELIPRAHWDPITNKDYYIDNYCMKSGKFNEAGERPKQGKRTDIDMIKTLVAQNAPMEEIYDKCTSYQAYRIGEIGKSLKSRKRNWVTEVYCFFGKSGSGKTRAAFEESGDNPWCSSGTLQWWDGYNEQENVIFDDFRADHVKFHILLQILDRYPFRVQVKGSSRELLAKKIIITSPMPPWNWYELADEKLEQLKRRITGIFEFPGRIATEWGKADNCTEVGYNTKDPTDLPNQMVQALKRRIMKKKTETEKWITD